MLNIFLFNTLFTRFRVPQHIHGVAQKVREYFLKLRMNIFLDAAAFYDGTPTELFYTFTSNMPVLLLAYQHLRSSKVIGGKFY